MIAPLARIISRNFERTAEKAGAVNALQDAQQALVVFRRALLELAAGRSLDRLANRVAKIVPEAKDSPHPNKCRG